MESLMNRKNMLEYTAETFRPPLHSNQQNILQRLSALGRYFLDLQFSSIWNDLSRALPTCRGTVLDIGCGAQPFRRLFNRDVNYIGIDTIEAKANFGYQNNDTLYYSGKILPCEDNKADAVLCTETLEHILEPQWLLKEINRCLKTHGKVLLTVPFAARWHFIPFDYWRYTPSSLKYLLNEAGFDNVKIYARGNQVTVACYKVMQVFLSLLFGKPPGIFKKIYYRCLGLAFFPMLFLAALIAHISMSRSGAPEDCLGFTLFAEKI